MATVLIDFFTQTGSTNAVADTIASVLRGDGHVVTVVKNGEAGPVDITAYDVVGVGSPTYAYRLPFPVSARLESYGRLNGMGFFAFLTYGTFYGKAPRQAWAMLAKKKGVHLGTHVTRGQDLFVAYLERGALFAPDSPTPAELGAVESFARDVSMRIEKREAADPPPRAKLGLIYRIERLLFARPLARGLYSRLFRVNTDRCTSCGRCAEICPVDNIVIKDNTPTFGRECILCFSCRLRCPVEAITAPVDRKMISPFMNFNVRHAKKKGVPFVRVEQKNGRTTRVE